VEIGVKVKGIKRLAFLERFGKKWGFRGFQDSCFGKKDSRFGNIPDKRFGNNWGDVRLQS